MKLTDSSDSEYASTSAPRRPWIASIAIHHNETARASPPILAAVEAARGHVICRSAAATTSHSSGAGTIIIKAVAFTAPTVNTTSAARRGVPPAAWMSPRPTVSPTIQPSPAHGRSIADVRETYGRTYGASW